MRERRGVRRVVARGALLLAGCAGGDDEAWQGTIARDGETVVVRNPAAPLLPDGAVTVERRWAVPGDALDDANAAWGRPFDVAIRGDTAFVLDVRNKAVHVVSLDGRWVRSFGRAGNGPGEFGIPSGLVTYGDSLAVFELMKGALQLFSPAGVPGRLVALPGPPYQPRLHQLGDGSLLVQRMLLRSADPGGGWQRLQANGELAPFAMPAAERLRAGVPAADSACLRMGVSGGTVLQYGCTQPVIRVVEATGAVSRSFGFPGGEAPELTEAARDSFRRQSAARLNTAGVDRQTAQRIASAQAASADRVRFWGAARDSATGMHLLWEQNSSAPGDVGALVHVFSPEGIYLARHRFPEPWRLMLFAQGDLLVSSTDEATGLERLARYRIALPPDALERAAAIARRAER